MPLLCLSMQAHGMMDAFFHLGSRFVNPSSQSTTDQYGLAGTAREIRGLVNDIRTQPSAASAEARPTQAETEPGAKSVQSARPVSFIALRKEQANQPNFRPVSLYNKPFSSMFNSQFKEPEPLTPIILKDQTLRGYPIDHKTIGLIASTAALTTAVLSEKPSKPLVGATFFGIGGLCTFFKFKIDQLTADHQSVVNEKISAANTNQRALAQRGNSQAERLWAAGTELLKNKDAHYKNELAEKEARHQKKLCEQETGYGEEFQSAQGNLRTELDQKTAELMEAKENIFKLSQENSANRGKLFETHAQIRTLEDRCQNLKGQLEGVERGVGLVLSDRTIMPNGQQPSAAAQGPVVVTQNAHSSKFLMFSEESRLGCLNQRLAASRDPLPSVHGKGQLENRFIFKDANLLKFLKQNDD